MITYIVKEGNEVIVEEKAKRELKKVVMNNLTRIIHNNLYKIDSIEDKGNQIIITVK